MTLLSHFNVLGRVLELTSCPEPPLQITSLACFKYLWGTPECCRKQYSSQHGDDEARVFIRVTHGDSVEINSLKKARLVDDKGKLKDDRHCHLFSHYVFYQVCLCFLPIYENNICLNSMKMLMKKIFKCKFLNEKCNYYLLYKTFIFFSAPLCQSLSFTHTPTRMHTHVHTPLSLSLLAFILSFKLAFFM